MEDARYKENFQLLGHLCMSCRIWSTTIIVLAKMDGKGKGAIGTLTTVRPIHANMEEPVM